MLLSLLLIITLAPLSSASLPDWYTADIDESSVGLDTNDNSTDIIDTNNGTDTDWDNSTDIWDTNVDDCDEICSPGTYHDEADLCMAPPSLSSKENFQEREIESNCESFSFFLLLKFFNAHPVSFHLFSRFPLLAMPIGNVSRRISV
jgi:hypothetical protein